MSENKLNEIPEAMMAVQLTGNGGPEKLSVQHDIPVPKIGEDEVLIRVKTCGMNNTDINTRVGWYSKSVTAATSSKGFGEIEDEQTWGGEKFYFPRIQGADVCGIVVDVGKNADSGLIGRRVLVDPCIRDTKSENWRDNAKYLGSEINGGFAQYCSVPFRNTYPVNSEMTDIELASFPCSWATAEHMLTRSRLRKGQTLVVTGASGGVGTALIQLAKLREAYVIAITSSEKFDLVKDCGADSVLDRNKKELKGNIIELAQGPVDVLADVAGGNNFAQLFEAITKGGCYVTAGAIAGPIVDLDLRTLYLNDIEMHGCTVYEPSVFKTLIEYIEHERVKPIIGGVFRLEEIRQAQEEFSKKQHVGTMILTVD